MNKIKFFRNFLFKILNTRKIQFQYQHKLKYLIKFFNECWVHSLAENKIWLFYIKIKWMMKSQLPQRMCLKPPVQFDLA